MTRCRWAGDDPLYVRYHDEEWGRPVHDDLKLFEMLNLEGAQAGLSWITILRKREGYRKAFAGFEPRKLAAFDAKKQAALMQDAGIVRNRLKIAAVVSNARAFLEHFPKRGDFDRYVWSFAGQKPEALSKDLKKRGFRFVGGTICYAFMQACGLVDDHAPDCFLARSRR